MLHIKATLCISWEHQRVLTYRGAHAGLVPGLEQTVKDPIVFPLRVAGVSGRAPQIGLLITTLLDLPVKILQRIFTA